MIIKVALAILETFIIFGIGAWIFYKKILDEDMLKKITKMTLDVFFPLLTFYTIAKDFDKDKISELWIMPVAGCLIMFASFFIGKLAKTFMRNKELGREGTFHHICTINNYVFLPIIVLENIYGLKHVALLLLMNVGSTVGLWTVGVIAFQGKTTFKKSMQSIFSINIFAVIVAIVWAASPVPIPEILLNISGKLGAMSVPLMLILVGGALYQCANNLAKNQIDLWYISILRLVIIPAILVVILKWLPLPKEIFEVLFIVALMPAASSSVLFAKQFNGSAEFAGQVILVTTILSLLTIPIMMKIFL